MISASVQGVGFAILQYLMIKQMGSIGDDMDFSSMPTSKDLNEQALNAYSNVTTNDGHSHLWTINNEQQRIANTSRYLTDYAIKPQRMQLFN